MSRTRQVRELGWTRTEPGEYRAELHGQAWRLERRRAEAGHPAGWYVYGPSRPSGEHAGDTLEAALHEATILALA